MCKVCANTLIVNARNYDPTNTATLRNAFVAESNRRFKALSKDVTRLIVDQDFFKLNKKEGELIINELPLNSQQYINSFMQWLKARENDLILQQNWVDTYIKTAYEKGIKRARTEMRKIGISVDDINTVDNLLGQEIIANLPYHVDQLGVLYISMLTELEGITAAMNAQILRILSEGLITGLSPVEMARMITKAISGTTGADPLGLQISYINKNGKTVSYFMSGRRRAEILARTLTIKAHHAAMIEEYRRWGIEGVTVLAEFVTANDDRVCPTCSALEGTVYTLDEALGLIPVHPQCRCIVLPYFEKGNNKIFQTPI